MDGGIIVRGLRAIAADIRADGAAADEHTDIQRKRAPLQRGKVGVHRFRGDAAGLAARDGGEVFQNLHAMRVAEGCKRQAAVAVQNGRQALMQLGISEAGAEHLCVAVAVNVQKAGCDAGARSVVNFVRVA